MECDEECKFEGKGTGRLYWSLYLSSSSRLRFHVTVGGQSYVGCSRISSLSRIYPHSQPAMS